MQTPTRQQSLLDSFMDYCVRSKSYGNSEVLSPTHSSMRYTKTPIHRKLKQKLKLTPNSVGIPTNLFEAKRRRMAEEANKQKLSDNRQLLNIKPVMVYSSFEPIKKTPVRANSTITINRRYLRAKTEGGFTQRSISPFITQQKHKILYETHENLCESQIQSYTSGEINRNRPFTAFPTSNNSINRLRTIQIQLPKHRKIGRILTTFDDSLSAWEAPLE